MAGFQRARSAVGESVAEFMERRRREVAQLGPDAAAAGHEAWAAATRAGDNLLAATPSDVRALGARMLGEKSTPMSGVERTASAIGPALAPRPNQPRYTSSIVAAKNDGGTIAYGELRAALPSDQELAELRRQQAAFGKTTREIDIRNSLFAAPVLAAPLAVMGLEAAGALAGRALARPAGEAALDFVEREPFRRVGDNWATRAGRRAHQALRERLDQKPGWEYEPRIKRPGERPLKPDGGTPPRNPLKPEERNYVELKPNTPSGRTAAERAVKRYLEASDRRVRKIFYDPGDFM